MIIAQATKEEDFICVFPDDSSSDMDLNKDQRNTLKRMPGSVSVMSGHNKAIAETAVGGGQRQGGGEVKLMVSEFKRLALSHILSHVYFPSNPNLIRRIHQKIDPYVSWELYCIYWSSGSQNGS